MYITTSEFKIITSLEDAIPYFTLNIKYVITTNSCLNRFYIPLRALPLGLRPAHWLGLAIMLDMYDALGGGSVKHQTRCRQSARSVEEACIWSRRVCRCIKLDMKERLGQFVQLNIYMTPASSHGVFQCFIHIFIAP